MSNPGLIKEYIEKYKPIEVYKDYSYNTDYPAVASKTKKNMYDAYVGVGFTEDQSLALMINDNILFMKNIKQVSSNNRSSKITDMRWEVEKKRE